MKILRVLYDGSSIKSDVDDISLDLLQSSVGGLIQAIDFTPGLTMWCNEEGKLLGLPVNQVATLVWKKYFGETDIIVGDVVFTGGCDEDGESTSILEEDSKEIEEICSTLQRL